MFLRPAPRLLARQPIPKRFSPLPKRFITTAPPHQRSRSWKSSAARWGIAIGGIYYYNTSPLFAEEPGYQVQEASPTQHNDESNITLASLSPSSRFQPPTEANPPSTAPIPTSSSPPSIDPKTLTQPEPQTSTSSPEPSSPSELESEASQQGAFNEETGEINWDCPCLGGMAHGPCGENFRAAFSCFVFSKEEPKGMDCIDKFKGMQDCFREHPEIYAAELAGDDEDEEFDVHGETAEGQPQTSALSSNDANEASTQPSSTEHEDKPRIVGNVSDAPHHVKDAPSVKADTDADPDDLVPRAAHDASIPTDQKTNNA